MGTVKADAADRALDVYGISKVARNAQLLSEQDGRRYDELARRAARGVATPENLAAFEACKKALEHRARLPPSAWLPLGPERVPDVGDEDIERITSMGIPPLIAVRIARHEAHEQLQTIAFLAASTFGTSSRHTTLVLIGETGCGKSFAASWWLARVRAVVPASFPKQRLTPKRLIDCDTIGTIDQRDLLEVADARALVLDDVGTEDDRYYSERVATLIARRYRAGLYTVITTNLAKADIGRRYGRRITDRLDEIGDFVVCGNNAAESLRRKEP